MSIIGAIFFWATLWEAIFWLATGLPNLIRIIIL